ncbi:MAG: DHH family phosphoesterase [Oscillospiraceae bacterium]|nr:DHH family phosphoesterase [Oscillospiraceae bacterium]
MKPKSNGRLKKYISEHRSFLRFVVNFFCVLLVLAFFWFSKTLEDYDKSIKLALIIFAVDIILTLIVIVLGGPDKSPKIKKKGAGDLKPLIENMTLDLIYDFAFPILITEQKGYILWHNGSAVEYLPQEDSGGLLWKNISAVSGNQISVEKFYENSDGTKSMAKPDKPENLSPVNIFINGKSFRVAVYKINSVVSPEVNELNIFVFTDMSEFEYLKTETEMKDPVAAYFMIDNLDETNQKMQDKYRNASGAVSDLLNEFIGNCGGVIKEYSKDKYLCFFENRDLKNFTKSKFGILDSVRDIKIEELDMPVTISGGVSNITGSLFEKEAAARHALDLALQRGGDQVVVKGLSSTEFFGGKTKTVQKRIKVRSRVIAGELAEYMQNSSNVLIMGHKFADNDSIGSCVGIARFAMSFNCEVNIIVNIHDPNIKPAFAKLRGLEEYKDIFTDEPAALDKITGETLVVVTDVNNPQYFESEAVYKNVYKCAVIDHHRKTIEYEKEPEIFYIEPAASSASELVAEILEQSLAPGALLKEEAELLLAGIFLDTKNFSRKTGTRTFSAALYLRGEGADTSEAQAMVVKTNVEEFTKEARFELNAITYRNIIAISVVEEELTVTDKTAGAKAAERMLGIDGITASFVIFKIEDTVHISARSLGKVNVQIILEAFGGGGHFEFAGAQVRNASLKDVLILLKKTIDEYFDAN